MAVVSESDNAKGNLSDESDKLIKSLISEQKRERSRSTLPELAPAGSEEFLHPDEPKKKRRLGSKSSIVSKLPKRVREYRPTKKHILIAALLLVVYFRPWLIPGILFVSFWVGLIAYLTLGPDRIHEKIAGGWDWLVRKHPKKAEKIRCVADKLALKFDALLDRLPEKWAEKLVLPDFSQPAAGKNTFEDMPDPFEKLKDVPEVYRG